MERLYDDYDLCVESQVGEARSLEREIVESGLTFAGFAVCFKTQHTLLQCYCHMLAWKMCSGESQCKFCSAMPMSKMCSAGYESFFLIVPT